jgi:four helix bundle protein
MQDYKKLDVWQKAHLLALGVYEVTRAFPGDELFGLTSQIRRSCISIPSNIIEGCGRGGNFELCQFLKISLGSANELEYQLLLAHDVKLLTASDYKKLDKQVNEIKAKLINLIKVVSKKPVT